MVFIGLQWVFNTTSNRTQTYPIAFSEQVFTAQITVNSSITGNEYVTNVSLTSVALYTIGVDGRQYTNPCYLFAMGKSRRIW